MTRHDTASDRRWDVQLAEPGPHPAAAAFCAGAQCSVCVSDGVVTQRPGPKTLVPPTHGCDDDDLSGEPEAAIWS